MKQCRKRLCGTRAERFSGLCRHHLDEKHEHIRTVNKKLRKLAKKRGGKKQ